LISPFDNEVGMNKYTLDRLLEKVPNKYLLILLIARKAKQIHRKVYEWEKRKRDMHFGDEPIDYEYDKLFKGFDPREDKYVEFAARLIMEDPTIDFSFLKDYFEKMSKDKGKLVGMEELKELLGDEFDILRPGEFELVDYSQIEGIEGEEIIDEDIEEIDIDEEEEEGKVIGEDEEEVDDVETEEDEENEEDEEEYLDDEI